MIEDGAALYYAYRVLSFDQHVEVSIFTSPELAKEGCREHHRLYGERLNYRASTLIPLEFECDDPSENCSALPSEDGEGNEYIIIPMILNQVIPYDT